MIRKSFLKTAFALCAMTLFASKKSQAKAKNLDKNKNFILDNLVFKVNTLSQIKINVPDKFAKDIDSIAISVTGDAGAISSVYNTDILKLGKDVKISKSANGIIVENVIFPQEQSYELLFLNKGNKLGSAKCMALNADLFALRPFKGDTHLHSTMSDGKNTPEEVVIRSLETGCDYQALSDHNKYEVSCLMADKFKDFDITMLLMNAEECHRSHFHVHSLGASKSVTKWIDEHKQEFKKRTDKIVNELSSNKELTDFEKENIAKAEVEFDIVREFGGVAVYNHPYWRAREVFYHTSPKLTDALCSRNKFDALEVVNGSCMDDSTDMAIATHSKMRLKGIDSPVIGTSDAHDISFQSTGYTILFAKECTSENVKKAILEKKSVAVDSKKYNKVIPFYYGDLRLMPYLYFLFEAFYPQHDMLCEEQSKILKKIVLENDSSQETKNQLSKKSKELRDYFDSFWAKY